MSIKDQKKIILNNSSIEFFNILLFIS